MMSLFDGYGVRQGVTGGAAPPPHSNPTHAHLSRHPRQHPVGFARRRLPPPSRAAASRGLTALSGAAAVIWLDDVVVTKIKSSAGRDEVDAVQVGISGTASATKEMESR